VNPKSLREQLAEAKAEIARLKKATRCKREPNLKTIGGILQASRERLGLSLRDVAKKSGVSDGLLSRIETSLNPNPTLANLRRVATAIQWPLSAIFAELENENGETL